MVWLENDQNWREITKEELSYLIEKLRKTLWTYPFAHLNPQSTEVRSCDWWKKNKKPG